MINPTEADIGRGVIYRCAPAFEAEPGVITSLGREADDPRLRTIFVRYATQHPTAPGQGTYAGDLEWENQGQKDGASS